LRAPRRESWSGRKARKIDRDVQKALVTPRTALYREHRAT
jgi:hypothetical protein